jgi:transcription termination factor Rho
LEVLADGSGLLHLEETGEDVFVPLEIIEQFHLSDGAGLVATARPPEKDESPADFRRVVEVVFRRVERTVEVLEEGHGFLRVSGAGPSPDDVYISAAQVERFGLSSGLTVIATARPPREGERYWSLAGIHNISGPPGEGEA